VRTEIGRIAPEELEHYRRVVARGLLARGCHPGLAPDEAVEAIVEDQKLSGELMERYDVDPDEQVYVSALTGKILLAD